MQASEPDESTTWSSIHAKTKIRLRSSEPGGPFGACQVGSPGIGANQTGEGSPLSPYLHSVLLSPKRKLEFLCHLTAAVALSGHWLSVGAVKISEERRRSCAARLWPPVSLCLADAPPPAALTTPAASAWRPRRRPARGTARRRTAAAVAPLPRAPSRRPPPRRCPPSRRPAPPA